MPTKLPSALLGIPVALPLYAVGISEPAWADVVYLTTVAGTRRSSRGVADDAITVTQAGSIGGAFPSCAIATVVPAGGIDVISRAVAPVTTAHG
jgi:hypothetical protein